MENELELQFQEAKALFNKHEYDAAAPIFVALTDVKKYEIASHYYLGLIHLNENFLSAATAEFEFCFQHEPIDVNYPYYLGVCAELRKNDPLALEYYNKVIAIDHNHLNAKKAIQSVKGRMPDGLISEPAGPAVEPEKEEPVKKNKGLIVRRIFLGILLCISLFCLFVYGYQYWGSYEWRTHNHNNEYGPYLQYDQMNPANYTGYLYTGIGLIFIVIFFWGHKKSNKTNIEDSFEPKFTDLYDELLLGTDKDSQIAVSGINMTKLVNIKPRLKAFLNNKLFFLILIPIITGFTVFGNPIMGVAIIVELFLLVFYFYYKSSQAIRTSYNIDRGLIEVKTGVFTFTYYVYWIHKADHFQMHQSFFNTLTNDCSLIFNLDGNQVVNLKGIGKPKEIQELAKRLESLRYQLRNTPAIRSGVYG